VVRSNLARSAPVRREEDRMAGFYFRLEFEDGTPADPPVLRTAVPNWSAEDTIPLGADRMLRVYRDAVC
jgi:hypothetical protein